MAYPAVELVNRSWYLSGIIARDQETVPGSYVTEGLYLLNALLDFKSSDLILIPYYQYTAFSFISGQELYFIPNLYEIQTMTFNLTSGESSVRYPMTQVQDIKYFGSGRVNNIQSLPFEYNLMRVKGGSELRVYYVPMDNYPVNFLGKFAMVDVTLNEDLLTVYDAFYIEYLRYALANMMCNEWDVEFSAAKKQMLMTYEQKLTYISPPDLSVQKVDILGSRRSFNWAQANIGRGYTPA